MLPPFVTERIAEWLGTTILCSQPIAGGMIAQAACVETEDGPIFLKWSENAPDRLFAEEAHGLELMRQTRSIRVPRVLAVCDRTPDLPQDAIPSTFLALEYISPQSPTNLALFTCRFAEQLAALHRAKLRSDPGYGLDGDNFIGLLPQVNQPRSQCWAEFYRDCRLMPQIRMAQHKGLLPPERERLVFAIADRMNDLLADIPPEISLIHGDLWTGNYLCARDDTPVLFDPSAYYGHREMEIAYIELFGGFLRDFVTFYNAVWPLDSGYPQRRPVHQLYHLLNHLNHFGERYGSAIEDICRTSLAGINI